MTSTIWTHHPGAFPTKSVHKMRAVPAGILQAPTNHHAAAVRPFPLTLKKTLVQLRGHRFPVCFDSSLNGSTFEKPQLSVYAAGDDQIFQPAVHRIEVAATITLAESLGTGAE